MIVNLDSLVWLACKQCSRHVHSVNEAEEHYAKCHSNENADSAPGSKGKIDYGSEEPVIETKSALTLATEGKSDSDSEKPVIETETESVPGSKGEFDSGSEEPVIETKSVLDLAIKGTSDSGSDSEEDVIIFLSPVKKNKLPTPPGSKGHILSLPVEASSESDSTSVGESVMSEQRKPKEPVKRTKILEKSRFSPAISLEKVNEFVGKVVKPKKYERERLNSLSPENYALALQRDEMEPILDFQPVVEFAHIPDMKFEYMFRSVEDELDAGHAFPKSLLDLRKARLEMFKSQPYSVYHKVVQAHYYRWLNIVNSGKGKLETCLKAFSGLELRMCATKGFENVSIKPEEMDALRDSMSHSARAYRPEEDMEDFVIRTACNEGLFMWDLETQLELAFFGEEGVNGSYGNPGIVYVPWTHNERETVYNPYTFYRLYGVDKGCARYWKEDHRLITFALRVKKAVSRYINNRFHVLFNNTIEDPRADAREILSEKIRKLQRSTGNVNECKQKKKPDNSVQAERFERIRAKLGVGGDFVGRETGYLIRNLCKMSNFGELCAMICRIVKKRATYIPSSHDVFESIGEMSYQDKDFIDVRSDEPNAYLGDGKELFEVSKNNDDPDVGGKLEDVIMQAVEGQGQFAT